MTISVSVRAPGIVQPGPLQIGRSVTMLGGLASDLAHLLGAQLSMICCQRIGKNEEPLAAGTRHYRYLFQAHPNARSVVVAMIPFGFRAGVAGTFTLTGAETVETLSTEQDGGAIVSLAELRTHDTFWTYPITPGAINDLDLEVTDATPHTIAIWETPRDLLTGTQEHVDRTIGDGGRYITDDTSASNPRGYKQLLVALNDAKAAMRRHVIMGSWPGGYIENSGVAVYLVGSATAGDGLLVYTRRVNKTGVTTVPVTLYFYIDTDRDGTPGGAGTHTIAVQSSIGSYLLAGIAGNVAGWAGPLDIEVAEDEDIVKIAAQRTAGAGGDTLEISSICGWEI